MSTDDEVPSSEGDRRGALAELGAFLRENKAFWLVPIAITLIVAVGIVVLAATGVAPYIYTFK